MSEQVDSTLCRFRKYHSLIAETLIELDSIDIKCTVCGRWYVDADDIPWKIVSKDGAVVIDGTKPYPES